MLDASSDTSLNATSAGDAKVSSSQLTRPLRTATLATCTFQGLAAATAWFELALEAGFEAVSTPF